MNTVKTIVVGAGTMGAHHARVLTSIPAAQLVGIVDLRQERASQVANRFGVKAYTDLERCIKECSPEAAIVATPTTEHFSVAQTLISLGINVLIEKPLAANLQEAESLAQLVERKGIIASVGHTERFNPAVRKLKELFETEALGELVSIHSRRLGLRKPHNPRPNVLEELGVHDIDVFAHLTGGYTGLSSELIWRKPQHGKTLLAGGLLLKKANLVGLIEASWICHYKLRSLTVVGSKAFAVVNYITQRISIFNGDRGFAFTESNANEFANFLLEFGELKRRDIPVEHAEPLKLQDEAFVLAVKRGIPPEISVFEGVAALRLASK